MNSENIYSQQQSIHQPTFNGNPYSPQDQLSAGVASMSLNSAVKYPPPPQQQQQQPLPSTQGFPPQNQKIYTYNGVNNLNNNINPNESNLNGPPLANSPLPAINTPPPGLYPGQQYKAPNMPYAQQSNLPLDMKQANMPPPSLQQQQQLHQQQQPTPSLPQPPIMQNQPPPQQQQQQQQQQQGRPPMPPMFATSGPHQNVNYMQQQQQLPNPAGGPPPMNQNMPPTLPPGGVPYPPASNKPPLPQQQQQTQQQPMQQNYYANDQRGVLPPLPPMSSQKYPNMPGNMAQQPIPSQPSPYQTQQQTMPPPPGVAGYPGAPIPQGHTRNYNQPTGMYGDPYQPPPSTQRRLDPDQMPNPIQVIQENQRQCGGCFITNQPGLLPPLVTTKYVTQDQGNSSPRFIRSSLYNIPTTADILKQTAMPFTLIVSPFAKIVEGEFDPPIVDFGELGPIRCIRCKAYMSPNMQFIDAGRRFQCLLCKATTEVPSEYFQHLDHTGQRVDKYERPELVLGTYEFVATKDYCRENKPPNPPAFVFVIDVSYNTIKSGLVHLLCQNIKQIISNLPVDKGQDKTKMKVGFITFNNVVHFYNIKSSLAQPQMMVVGDTQDMFMPLLDGFLCDAEESEAVIDTLMEQIPNMFVDTKETETVLLPAIQAGLEALKASNCAGKLFVFNSSLPIAEAPGKLKNRDDRKLLGTEKEKTILTPQTQAYNQLGQECVQAGCSVDLFVFNNSYVDVATIGQVSRLTGGEVYKYTYFQADIDGERLIKDICINISRPIAFDGVMRVRTSTGVRPTDFYGHYFMSNTTDMELASIDSSKAVAIEIKHDDKLSPEENVYVQVALLYTSCGGQRRLRIMNLVMKTTSEISEVFRSCDVDATILFFAKQSIFKLMELTPKAVKDNLINRSAQILASYRKNCTSPSSAGQLILPECLKLLPLYISCLLKNDALFGGSDMTCDDRSYCMQFVLVMNLPISVFYFYPRLIPIHDVDVNETNVPLPIRCTYEKMCEDGAYILENGIHMFIWIGLALSPEFLQSLFGVQSTLQVNAERFQLSQVPDSPLANRIKQIINAIREERSKCMRVTIVRQNDKLETVFKHYLVEDRGTDGSASYVDFLCHMHKEIKELLS